MERTSCSVEEEIRVRVPVDGHTFQRNFHTLWQPAVKFTWGLRREEALVILRGYILQKVHWVGCCLGVCAVWAKKTTSPVGSP